jgi:cytochrome c oxidase cbb3-type subunit 3
MSVRFRVFTLVLFTLLLLPACKEKKPILADNPQLAAYDVEPDWNDPQRTILLNYQQAQGKRVFYNACVWCHAEATPAGPSNRSNVMPPPPLLNDGNVLNSVKDDALQNIISLGGDAVGKSSMMPPWGRTLTQEDISALIAFIRVVSQPPYQAPPARPAP